MFDLGWQEFLLVAIITVIVVGPKDLPRVVRSVSQFVRKARSMAREFQSSLEEVAREAELDDVRREVQSMSKDGIGKSIEKQIDPDGSMRESVEGVRKAAGAEEIEAEVKSLGKDTQEVAARTPTAAPVETADDYAAKSVGGTSTEDATTGTATKTETAAGKTEPAEPGNTRQTAGAATGHATSGQG